MDQNQAIDTLYSLLVSSQHTIAFTGAGMSTESGIPDFRSPGGLWDRYQPIYFDEFMGSEEMRRESWRRKLETDKVMTKAQPNSGHQALASLVEQGHIHSVITQNIDGLHQAAGVCDDRVIELHGNSTYAVCLDCEKRFDLQPILEQFSKDETLPVCDSCSGIVKTGTISFGQPMPVKAMSRAEQVALQADLVLVLGSSLSVYPAAAFPEEAVRRGAKLAVINRDPTTMDSLAQVVINEEIGPTLEALMGLFSK